VLFAGDALRSDKNGNPKLPSKMMSLDIVRAIDSLRELAELEFEALLVGHGAPVLKQCFSEGEEPPPEHGCIYSGARLRVTLHPKFYQ